MASKRERTLENWKHNIRLGIEHQRKYGKSRDWAKWDKYYSGEWAADEVRQKLPMNYIFAQFHSLIPQIYFRNPRIWTVARRPGNLARAKVLEENLNWLIQEMNVKAQMKRAALYALLYGTGFLKLGYDSEHGLASQVAMGFADETDMLRPDLREYRKLEYNADVQAGMPWVLAVHPADMVIDPSCTSIHDARWIAHRVIRPVEDVRNDPKYQDAKDVEPNLSEEYSDRDQAKMLTPENWQTKNVPLEKRTLESVKDEWVELWEIRDAQTQKVYVLGLEHNKVLRDEVDALQIDGLPFIPIIFNANPRTFWGISDVQVLHPQQTELNKIRELQAWYRTLGVRRIMIEEGLLTPEEKEKWLSTEPVAFVEFKGEGAPLGDRIREFQGFIPPDLSAWSEQVEADMRDLLGQGRNQMGEFARGMQGGASRATATEAGIVQQNAAVRVDERRDTLGEALKTAMRRVAQIIFKFWTGERVSRISGPMGGQIWVQYTGEQLRGEYDFELQPDDALQLTKRQRQADALMLWQAIAPALIPPQQQALLRYVLNQFENVDPDNILAQPTPSGMPVGLDQLEAAMQGSGGGNAISPEMQGVPMGMGGGMPGGGAPPAGMPPMQ